MRTRERIFFFWRKDVVVKWKYKIYSPPEKWDNQGGSSGEKRAKLLEKMEGFLEGRISCEENGDQSRTYRMNGDIMDFFFGEKKKRRPGLFGERAFSGKNTNFAGAHFNNVPRQKRRDVMWCVLCVCTHKYYHAPIYLFGLIGESTTDHRYSFRRYRFTKFCGHKKKYFFQAIDKKLFLCTFFLGRKW